MTDVRAYYQLVKPGMVYGNALTAIAAFVCASQGTVLWLLFAATIIGLSCIIASACVFNNLLDRDIDALMERTKERALPSHTVSPRKVFIEAFALLFCGVAILFSFTNILALICALTGFIVYVFLYTPLKRRTIYATHIGAIAGAMPPVVGYAAVSHSLDLVALTLFLILFVWQMAHFFSIAIYRQDEYAAAKIPVMPIVKGVARTKTAIVAYVATFAIAVWTLAQVARVGYVYAVFMSIACVVWLALGLYGFSKVNVRIWARKMFVLSLIVLVSWCVALAL